MNQILLNFLASLQNWIIGLKQANRWVNPWFILPVGYDDTFYAKFQFLYIWSLKEQPQNSNIKRWVISLKSLRAKACKLEGYSNWSVAKVWISFSVKRLEDILEVLFC